MLKLKQPRYSPLAVKLRQLTPGKIRRAAAEAIERELTELIDERFQTRSAPDGSKWAPRKPPTGSWPLLEKTGAMRRGFTLYANATGVVIAQSQDYLKYLNSTRTVIPTRLPQHWITRINSSVAEALRKL